MMFEEKTDLIRFLNAKEFFNYSYPGTTTSIRTNNIMNLDTSQSSSRSDYLVAFSTSPHSYCVGCVDMVNSTKISAVIPSNKLCGYYETFLNSMSKIIGKFGGKVIKNVGDCLLYYFPDTMPSKKDGHKNCLDCGLAMIEAQPILCQQLISKKLPCISYRVSADFGRVLLMNTTDSLSIDLIGPPVNMCAKINHCAKQNEFVIGSDLYEAAKKPTGYKFQQISSYDVGFKHSYPVYKVRSH